MTIRTPITRIECSADDLPVGLLWVTLPQHAGQSIEVSYANSRCPNGVDPSDADYKRVTDRSVVPVTETYYRREDVPAIRWAMLDRTGTSGVIAEARSNAEGYSLSWHGHDRVLQVDASDRYRDATGRVLSARDALAVLRGVVCAEVAIERDGICPRCWSTDVSRRLGVCWSCDRPRQEPED